MKLGMLAAVTVFALGLTYCSEPAAPIAADKPKRPAVPVESVVRISIDGYHAGSGVAVSADGLIVTDLSVITRGYSKFTGAVTVDDVPAAIVELDQQHKLALVKTTGTFRPVVLADRSATHQMDLVRVVAYTDVLSDPPMVEKKTLDGNIHRLHYRGESVSGLDLNDICLIGRDWRNGVGEKGAGVFLADSGKLLGISVGEMRSGELMVMPAETVKILLKRHSQ